MDIYSLLNIKLEVIQDLPLQANRVADLQIERIINKNTNRLKRIEENFNTETNINVPHQSIEEIINKVICFSREQIDIENNWSIRELKIISYSLIKLQNDNKAYIYAISLLNKYWRNFYFNGLVSYLMNSWHSIRPEYRELTGNFLVCKLQEYTGFNKRLLQLKDHANLFENMGPKRMATIILLKGMNLVEAPSLLGYRSSFIGYSYFSDVIIHFFKEKDINDFTFISNIFKLHNLDRTKKLVLAHLIFKENQTRNETNRIKLCHFINEIIGDVTLASTWAPFIGANEDESKVLKDAMRCVNSWHAQKIIEIFFEICVQDKSRKEFWIKYINFIENFKIIGSNVISSLLSSHDKINGFYQKYFIETKEQTSQTSALALFMGDKVLVEFSDIGALYVFKKNHPKARLITSHNSSIFRVSDIKETSINSLVESDYYGDYLYRDEGRLPHLTNWQKRLTKWIDKKLPFSIKTEETYKTLKLNTSSTLTNIEYKLYSEAISPDFRIIANDFGFYLHSIEGEFILIKRNEYIYPLEGSIWIKKTFIKDWFQIILTNKMSQYSIGYFKVINRGINFKDDLQTSPRKIIRF